ncbi:hypothetical protein Pla100_39610 [Neorhodopirellula pilleata]|uniref:Uncharacterized protein n=1 Tax=Neorhodopirellula pilleata TaxID=2714738 RepID=A0A5C6A4F4_9BACT|nr:hypothetical protein Pla100_39610 [Neorhodopirellula pilleata]
MKVGGENDSRTSFTTFVKVVAPAKNHWLTSDIVELEEETQSKIVKIRKIGKDPPGRRAGTTGKVCQGGRRLAVGGWRLAVARRLGGGGFATNTRRGVKNEE